MVRVFTVVFVAAMPGGSGKRVAPQHFHSSVFFTVSQPPSSPLSSILDVHKLLQPNKLQTYTAFAVFICPVATGLVLTPDDSVIKNDTFFFQVVCGNDKRMQRTSMTWTSLYLIFKHD